MQQFHPICYIPQLFDHKLSSKNKRSPDATEITRWSKSHHRRPPHISICCFKINRHMSVHIALAVDNNSTANLNKVNNDSCKYNVECELLPAGTAHHNRHKASTSVVAHIYHLSNPYFQTHPATLRFWHTSVINPAHVNCGWSCKVLSLCAEAAAVARAVELLVFRVPLQAQT